MENKSMGGALVDVFDAAFGLVKSEINAVTRRVGNIARAKGLGVVLLLASLVPLTLALIFLILFVFYGLERLGLGAWAAALLLGLLSLIVTGGLIFVGLRKLGGDVPDDDDQGKLSDIAKDDLKYGYAASGTSSSDSATPEATPVRPAEQGHTTGGHPVPGVSQTPAHAAPARPADLDRPAGGPNGGADGVPAGTGASTGTGTVTAPQSTSTQGKPTNENEHHRTEQRGIEVSTHPTYKDDMKKEGY